MAYDQPQDIDLLYRQANEGAPDAQAELAMRLHNGDGVPQDQSAAALWLRKAAEGGDAWAQTQYAILLRATKEPHNERESVEWLKRAIEQGDDRARLTLGMQQQLGIGTAIDLEVAVANMIMASLGGIEDAQNLLARLQDELKNAPSVNWEAIFDRVRWAFLTFVLGPPADGHLVGLTKLREQDDGTNDARWLKYEREVANAAFLGEQTILSGVFGCAVHVKKLYVGRVLIEDQTGAAITINMRDIVKSDGFPIWSKPQAQSLDALVRTIGAFKARKWLRWSYTSF